MVVHKPPQEPKRCACFRWKRVTPFHCPGSIQTGACGRWKPSAWTVCRRCAIEMAQKQEAA